MPQHTPPAAPSPITTASLSPGQSLWLHLPPGRALRTTQGEVGVRFAPSACGQALHTPPHARLQAGQQLPGDAQSAQAAWVLVDNALHCPAEIQVIEGTPAPGLWHKARQLLRTLAGRSGSGRAYGGALHATR